MLVRSGMNNTVQYLKGKRVTMNKQNIIVDKGEFYQISAVINACKGSIFVEVQNNHVNYSD